MGNSFESFKSKFTVPRHLKYSCLKGRYDVMMNVFYFRLGMCNSFESFQRKFIVKSSNLIIVAEKGLRHFTPEGALRNRVLG